jgi:hypothetical protein
VDLSTALCLGGPLVVLPYFEAELVLRTIQEIRAHVSQVPQEDQQMTHSLIITEVNNKESSKNVTTLLERHERCQSTGDLAALDYGRAFMAMTLYILGRVRQPPGSQESNLVPVDISHLCISSAILVMMSA